MKMSNRVWLFTLLFAAVHGLPAHGADRLLEKLLDLCKAPISSRVEAAELYKQQKQCVRKLLSCVEKRVAACGEPCFIPAGANHQDIVRSCGQDLGK